SLLRGLGHFGAHAGTGLVGIVHGGVLRRTGIRSHHLRGVPHAVLRRTGRGAHAVLAGHGILLLGGVSGAVGRSPYLLCRLSARLEIMPAHLSYGMYERASGAWGTFRS